MIRLRCASNSKQVSALHRLWDTTTGPTGRADTVYRWAPLISSPPRGQTSTGLSGRPRRPGIWRTNWVNCTQLASIPAAHADCIALGHVMGFKHEHQRPDAGKFIVRGEPRPTIDRSRHVLTCDQQSISSSTTVCFPGMKLQQNLCKNQQNQSSYAPKRPNKEWIRCESKF